MFGSNEVDRVNDRMRLTNQQFRRSIKSDAEYAHTESYPNRSGAKSQMPFRVLAGSQKSLW